MRAAYVAFGQDHGGDLEGGRSVGLGGERADGGAGKCQTRDTSAGMSTGAAGETARATDALRGFTLDFGDAGVDAGDVDRGGEADSL